MHSMKKARLCISFLVISALLSYAAFAAQTGSGSYRQNVVVSDGSENSTSASYRQSIAVGIINGILSSASYINKLGFFHILLLAGGQPCTSGSQCEGGFCCSNLCSSSSCPTGAAAAGGGGGAAAAGGGGEGIVQQISDFSMSPDSMHETIQLGDTKINTLTIRNTGNTQLSFGLSVAAIGDFVSLSDTGFGLDAGQEKAVQAIIIGKQVGSYFGEIKAAAGGIEKSATVVVDVQSDNVLFDVKIDIPTAYKEVAAGGDLKVQITLFNVGAGKKVDVTPTYIIKDRQGNAVYESSETFAVEIQKSYVKTIRIPKDLKPGDYLAIVELRYEKSFAVSSELFKVISKEETAVQKVLKSKTAMAYALAVVIGLVSLFVYLLVPKGKIFKNPEIEKAGKKPKR